MRKQHIFLKIESGNYLRIDVSEILYVVANGKKTILVMSSNERYVVNHLLKEIDRILRILGFVRISRGIIVNFQHCTHVKFKPTPMVYLLGDINLRISYRNVKKMLMFVKEYNDNSLIATFIR